jgi:hypothetical protein
MPGPTTTRGTDQPLDTERLTLMSASFGYAVDERVRQGPVRLHPAAAIIPMVVDSDHVRHGRVVRWAVRNDRDIARNSQGAGRGTVVLYDFHIACPAGVG